MKTVAFDFSAMFVAAANDTPRGIDRVDLGYAKRFFQSSDADHVGLLPSPSRMGVLTNAEARTFTSVVERRWRENAAPDDDDALSAWLRRRLLGESAPPPPRRRGEQTQREIVLRYARLVARARRTSLRPAAARVPHGAVYVNTGQILLGSDWFFAWLEQRRDVKPIFMMHDLIPIFYPEYSGPEMASRHERALDTVARHAAGMIATSRASADEIREALKKRGRGDMPIHVTHLPVPDSFLPARDEPALVADAPYFVAVGSIDQRKNHRLLLNVWRELARSDAAARAMLVIVGPRGKRSTGVVDFMRRCPALARHVVEVNGLSTPAMRELIRGARALLMPSFTEGFGLPVVEALALGTPVIASDIPSHREIGGRFAAYLDPLDGTAWLAEVVARAQESAEALRARRAALARYQPQTWAAYFDQVSPFIDSL